MAGYLIYHPKRQISSFGRLRIYHDSTSHNQDPYIWNTHFLHSYCHITQMSPAVGDINLWISGDNFPNFSQLWCDLVFVVEEKAYWSNCNEIESNYLLVDSAEAFNDHYRWASVDHPYKKRTSRFTLKGNAERSFQPQTEEGTLIDVAPLLMSYGLTMEQLRGGMRAGFAGKPMPLASKVLQGVSNTLEQSAARLHGQQLQAIRQKHPHLAS